MDKDIGGAVQQAMNDLRSSYQIGYYPPPNNWDGKFHKLRVTTKRKGVRIQAKTGYYAWDLPSGARAQDAFAATAAAAVDAGEIGLIARVSPDPPQDNSRKVDVTVDTRDIALAQDGANYTAQLRVVTISYSPQGRASESLVIPFDFHYGPGEREKALADGIRFSTGLPAAAKESKFRIVVFDQGSNAVGSVTIPASALAGDKR